MMMFPDASIKSLAVSDNNCPVQGRVILAVEKIDIYICNRVYCIHVPGHDAITFSFRSFSFLIGWGVYGPII